MHAFFSPTHSLTALQLLASVFLAILFLQSGLDKIWAFRANLDWLHSHFSKSILAGMAPLLLTLLIILEVSAGTLSTVGIVIILVKKTTLIAYYGAIVSAIALIALFFGQRMAKDYPGAATLVGYFLLALAAIYLLAQPLAGL